MQRPERHAVYVSAPRGLFNLISFITRITSPGVGLHSMDCFLSNQSLMKNVPFILARRLILQKLLLQWKLLSSQMTLACAKLTLKQPRTMYFGETQFRHMQMLTRKKTKSREKREGPRMPLLSKNLNLANYHYRDMKTPFHTNPSISRSRSKRNRSKAENVIQLAKCLPSKQEAMGSITTPQVTNPGTATRAYK